MARRRRYCYCCIRNCALLITLSIVFLTALYEIMVYCALGQPDLDNRTKTKRQVSASYERFQNSVSRRITHVHADKVLQEFAGFRQPELLDLETHRIIDTVHYVWCSNSTFEFKNYLSVLSVWKVLQPDIIEFHEHGEVRTDKYNDWFHRIQKTIPSFVRKPLPKHWDGDEKGCGFWFGIAVLDDRGGIYIGSDVIVTEDLVKNKQQNLTIMFHRSSAKEVYEIAVAMSTNHLKKFRQFRRDFDGNNEINFDSTNKKCSTYTNGANISGNECFVIKDGLHPTDFFQDQSESGAFFRKLMYGTSQVIKGEPVLPGFIPKIVHYVWFGGKEMSFMMYLSMLSTLFILNPQKVYIHGDGGLFGKYVDRIKLDDRVIFVNREKPYYIFGHDVLYIQHRSDILRADCLLKYGGIYMDWDVLWLRDPTDVISRGHDAVANFDHMERTGFPDTINLGVLMAKQKSVFMKRWQDALLNYKSKDFLYNAVELPYKIYEEFPQYLYIEKRLQVMCFHLKCHPTFHPRFKSYMEEQPFNWREDVYSIHYTYPDPPEFDSYESLVNATGSAAEIGHFIMKHSPKLDRLTKA